MSRYKNTKLNRDTKSNQLSYRTSIYKEVPESNNDIYVITQTGDRLDHLAQQFYGNSNLWWFIAHVNNINTINLKAGVGLRISFDLEKASSIPDKSR